MPQQRFILVVTVEKSPQQRIEIRLHNEKVAKKTHETLEGLKGATIVGVEPLRKEKSNPDEDANDPD